MEMLQAHRIAVLAASGVDQEQLEALLNALKEAGAEVSILADRSGTLTAWDGSAWGTRFKVTRTVMYAEENAFDAVCVLGGPFSMDALRANKHAVGFVRAMFTARKPVAAMGHGPQLLVDADVLDGHHATSAPTIRNDLRNAGAVWEDAPVVVDEGLVTSRGTADLPAFIGKVVEEVWEGRHQDRAVRPA